jgi:DNA-binding transcriptional ArsR family regulator
MTDADITRVAEHFRALAEPTRLLLLRELFTGGEHTVNELVDETGLQQANVSKHLQVLFQHGFLKRRKYGLFVYYAIADRQVAKLCQLMCQRVAAEDARGGDDPAE